MMQKGKRKQCRSDTMVTSHAKDIKRLLRQKQKRILSAPLAASE